MFEHDATQSILTKKKCTKVCFEMKLAMSAACNEEAIHVSSEPFFDTVELTSPWGACCTSGEEHTAKKTIKIFLMLTLITLNLSWLVWCWLTSSKSL